MPPFLTFTYLRVTDLFYAKNANKGIIRMVKLYYYNFLLSDGIFEDLPSKHQSQRIRVVHLVINFYLNLRTLR